MNTNKITMAALIAPAVLMLAAGVVTAQSGQGEPTPNANSPQNPQKAQQTFGNAAQGLQQQLEQANQALAALRASIGDEKLPLTRKMRELEDELQTVRREYQDVSRLLDSRTLDLGNMRTELEQRRSQSQYLTNLLGEYNRKFESRLHIAESQRYQQELDAARLAMENTALSEDDLFNSQLTLIDKSIDQLEDALGGTRFDGRAVSDGIVKQGTFVLLGPTALFRSGDGLDIGMVEEQMLSQEPAVVSFTAPEDREAAAQLVLGTGGSFPLDPTLGNAQKVENLQESWWEHVQKGGVVMIPMFVLAAAALLVVLFKWLSMMFVRRPSRKQVTRLLDYIDGSDYASAVEQAETLRGPAGKMLLAGAQHLGEPRELVEEVMYEKVLSTRLKLQSWLPFVAICATSAPLLGLLGTVTGIMNTFSLMTEFGTGDPKTLSSGISEALITTEHGLIVAIPSLLLHAFLSRKARGIIDDMEKTAVQFMNHVRSPRTVEARDQVGVA